MGYRYKEFTVAGAPNAITLDDEGLQSTQEEKRHIVSVLLGVNDFQGNNIVGYIDQEKVVEIPDYLIGNYNQIAVANQQMLNPFNEIEIDEELPVGVPFKMGVESGGVGLTLRGSYKYKIIS